MGGSGHVSCLKCDVLYRAPLPDPVRLQEIYNQGYYDSWGENVATSEYWALKRHLFVELLSIAGAVEGRGRMLDVGCATGACLSVFTDAVGEPYGVDVNPYAVEAAKKNVPQAQVFCGPLEAAPYEDEFFDLVVLSDVLEHVADPRKLLTSIARKLLPGGQVIILTPNIHSWSKSLMRSFWPHYKEEHLILFGRRSLARLLRDAGLDTVLVTAFRKPVSIAYVTSQLIAYPSPVLTSLMKAFRGVLPHSFTKRVWRIPMGELVLVARRGV